MNADERLGEAVEPKSDDENKDGDDTSTVSHDTAKRISDDDDTPA